MRTRLYLTHKDHGREVTDEELESCEAEAGYKYEVVEGRLDVSPQPGFAHSDIMLWLLFTLREYSLLRPEIINHVNPATRIFVPGGGRTRLEPDLSAYRGFPLHLRPSQVHWRDVSPLLVAEIVSPDTAAKDLERNRELYLRVPTIREYWIIDTREDFDHPSLIVLRRRGRRWVEKVVVPGATYETPLLPGLALVVAPRPD